MDRLHTRLALCTATLLLLSLPTAYWAFPSSGQTQSTPETLADFHSVEQKILAGELDAAQKQVTRIIEVNPKDGRAWLLWGKVYEKRGDLDQAAVAYRQAGLLKDPDAADTLDNLMTSKVLPTREQAEQGEIERLLKRGAHSYSQEELRLFWNYTKLGDHMYPNGDLMNCSPRYWTPERALPRSLSEEQ